MPTVIDLKAESQEGSYKLQLHENTLIFPREFSDTYYVVGDNLSQTSDAIIAAPGIPALGASKQGAYCTALNVKAVTTVVHFLTAALTQLYEVEAQYSNIIRNPNDTNPEVDWDGEMDKEAMEYDLLTNEKVMTRAGEPIFTERQVPMITFETTRKEAYPFDPGTIALYAGRVNSEPFYGFPPGSCMMLPMKVREDVIEGNRVCWVTYRVKIKVGWDFEGNFRENTWQASLLNQGYKYRKAIGAVPEISVDKSGNPIKTNLDEDGLKLKDDKGSDLVAEDSTAVRDQSFDPVIPSEGDVGSLLVIADTPANISNGWIPESYVIIGIESISGNDYWILDETVAAPSSTNGEWTLQRQPVFLEFNRAIPLDFNGLSLGPY